ncbi:MAG: ribonuclease HII [Flavobacteriales bacterium]
MITRYYGPGLEIGCDEAGRGCLAGPVYAAAVAVPENGFSIPVVDSKQMNLQERERSRAVIEAEALDQAVAWVNPEGIDRMNILEASFEAMHLALDRLVRTPDRILVDGNRFRPYRDIPYHCCVKGDGTYLAIAAASILAKTYRDERMRGLAEDHPAYGWERNKGYPTPEHRKALQEHGITPWHRKSFVKGMQWDLTSEMENGRKS